MCCISGVWLKSLYASTSAIGGDRETVEVIYNKQIKEHNSKSTYTITQSAKKIVTVKTSVSKPLGAQCKYNLLHPMGNPPGMKFWPVL